MKKGFTLSEILITLGIIGVVAAISLPRFIDNMTERANSERHANIAPKVTQAMEQMRAHGLLNQSYPTTEAFVDELQKYLKIVKICDKDNIKNCWPTETITTSTGQKYDISIAKTGSQLNLGTETNNVGLIMADGGALIINYNPNADLIDIGSRIESYTKQLPIGIGTKEFPYSSSVTGSIDFVTDVNNKKSPNSEMINGKLNDIRSFRIASFTKCDNSKKINGKCVIDVGKGYDCVNGCRYEDNNNCWEGAKEKCKSLGLNLATREELKQLYDIRNDYSFLPETGIYWTSFKGNNCDAGYFNFETGNGDGQYQTSKNNVICIGN